MTQFADLFSFSEDRRIEIIGNQATLKIVGVALEKDQTAKIERYIERVTSQFPNVRHIETRPGLTPNTVLVKFGPNTNRLS